jgi:sulfatase modifying factor 1
MKRLFPIILAVLLILILVVAGCGGNSGSGNPGGGNPGGITYTPGQASVCTVYGVSFNMRYARGGSFASDDAAVTGDSNLPATITVSNPFWIAETEVTYQLWYAVYAWATDPARGTNQYYFFNTGREGSMGTYGAVPTANSQHPVTWINWRDAMVWCNALTEYYNAANGTSLACVYTDSGNIIRDSRDSNQTACDNVTAVSTAKGFRLPTSGEWELAARYQDGSTWTPGNHVSGDTTSYCYSNPPDAGRSTVFGNYAWYYTNSGSSTHPAGEKTANALNIKDMSGNVWEWCFDWYPGSEDSYRVRRGGNWLYPSFYLQIGQVSDASPVSADNIIGFRIVRNL